MSHVVFVGPMGAGKSTAAQAAGATLGRPVHDSDQAIEERLGRPIAEVFSRDGEGAFREAEERVVRELLADPEPSVLALGGGAVLSAAVRQDLRAHLVVWLDLDAESAWQRVEGSERPLARRREEFAALLGPRERLYEEVARAIVPGPCPRLGPAFYTALSELPRCARLLWGSSASGDYPAFLREGLLAEGFWPQGLPGRRYVVSDGRVAQLYGDLFADVAGRISVMPGEGSKTVAHAEIVWTELLRGGATRSDVVVALGGGVVGDLAGFCAATYQRGVRFVQVPTTLVAQVDSAYGGKTGVDLAEAKNYVGAYHQPSAVIADTATLATLPPEEVAAGYAEVVKTALIAGGALWERVRGGADPIDPEIVCACARTKLGIVARDERDGSLRQVLNLGHTVAHAIESSTGYARYRHGEAVSLGLLAALRLSGLDELRSEVAALLAARGLPIHMEDVDPDAVVMATARDKKRLGEGGVPFVLVRGPGTVEPGCPVAPRELIGAVRELVAP